MIAPTETLARFTRRPTRKVIVRAATRRTSEQVLAGIFAGFFPVLSYTLAHYEAPASPPLYILVAAALLYSAPTLASWMRGWVSGKGGNAKLCWMKAWGGTVLLEGVLVFSHMPALNVTALVLLATVNTVIAYHHARK